MSTQPFLYRLYFTVTKKLVRKRSFIITDKGRKNNRIRKSPFCNFSCSSMAAKIIKKQLMEGIISDG